MQSIKILLNKFLFVYTCVFFSSFCIDPAIAKQEATHRIQEISPEEMQRLRECGDIESQGGEVHEIERNDRPAGRSVGNWSLRNLNISGGSGGDGKGAIVLFAVIGVVILVAIIPYTISYIYDLMQGNRLCYFREQGLSFFSSKSRKLLNNDTLFKSENDYAAYNYVINIDRRRSSDLALSMELGYQVINGEFDEDKKRYQEEGALFLIGPKLYFARHLPTNSHFFLEILGGASTNPKIGTLSKAQFGVKIFPRSFGNFGFGLALGSFYTDAQPRSGIRDIADQFESFFAFSLYFK